MEWLSRTNPVEKASVAICSVKKHKMPELIRHNATAPPHSLTFYLDVETMQRNPKITFYVMSAVGSHIIIIMVKWRPFREENFLVLDSH